MLKIGCNNNCKADHVSAAAYHNLDNMINGTLHMLLGCGFLLKVKTAYGTCSRRLYPQKKTWKKNRGRQFKDMPLMEHVVI